MTYFNAQLSSYPRALIRPKVKSLILAVLWGTVYIHQLADTKRTVSSLFIHCYWYAYLAWPVKVRKE